MAGTTIPTAILRVWAVPSAKYFQAVATAATIILPLTILHPTDLRGLILPALHRVAHPVAEVPAAAEVEAVAEAPEAGPAADKQAFILMKYCNGGTRVITLACRSSFFSIALSTDIVI